MLEISPIERKKVPASVPHEAISAAKTESERKRIGIKDAMRALEEEKKKMLERTTSSEKIASGITYLDICESFISLPSEKERISRCPRAIQERKMKEFAKMAAEMNQNMMFVVRQIRTQPDSDILLKEIHDTFRAFVRKNYELTTLENYDNWIGGIFTELAIIEATMKIKDTFHINGKVIKSTPEEDVGLGESGEKIDFFIEKDNGESIPFQIKSTTGVDENWIEVEKEKGSNIDLRLLSVFSRKTEDVVNLTNGRYNDNIVPLLSKELVKKTETKWEWK